VAHAIWKGTISFGLVEIPVGLYAASDDSSLHFSLLDKRDLAPVGYERINKKTGEAVDWENIVRGYDQGEGQYVLVTDDELKQANAEATETIEIVEFVDVDDIDSVFYDRPYYLGPLSRGGKAYALLRATLLRTGKVGIARVVIRTRQYVAALTVRGRVLVLNLLRYAHELRSADELGLPSDNLEELGIAPRELELAERLVAGMEGKWQPEKYTDQYRDQVLALIAAKAKTGEAASVATPRRRAVTGAADIMELLKASLQHAKAANVDVESRPAGKRTRRPRRAAPAGKK
jgi:DNA end-binding protein Ku